MNIKGGSTDVTTYFVLRTAADGTATTGATIANIDLQYVRTGAAPSAKVDAIALAATDSDHAANKAIEVDGTDAPGLYRVDWPDAAFAAGVKQVILSVKLAASFTEHMAVEIDPPVGVAASVTGAVGSVTGAVGSVTGAVGSVTGAVGSVAGNVDGSTASVAGAVGSVTGAVGSVTGAVGSVAGNVDGSVASVAGNVDGSVASVAGAVGSVAGNVDGSVASVTAGVSLADGAVTAAKLGADCITNAKIADNAIAVENIKDAAITAAKLAGDCITNAKIANDAIAVENIKDAAITAAKLAADCITSAKYDESTAFPVKAADTGATQIARVGADGDTLEDLSDEIGALDVATVNLEISDTDLVIE